MNDVREALIGTCFVLLLTQCAWPLLGLLDGWVRVTLTFAMTLAATGVIALAFTIIWWNVLIA